MDKIYNPAIDAALGQGEGTSALADIFGRVFVAAVSVGSIALLLYMAWGGLQWIMAGGDKGKVEEAKNRITNAIIGMAILVATVAVAMFLNEVFGLDLLNPEVPGIE